MPSLVRDVLLTLLWIYWVLLIVRLIASWVFAFRRDARASGPVAALLEVTYTLTDPPLKLLSRVLPPLRFGNVQLDLGLLVLFIVVGVLRGTVASL